MRTRQLIPHAPPPTFARLRCPRARAPVGKPRCDDRTNLAIARGTYKLCSTAEPAVESVQFTFKYAPDLGTRKSHRQDERESRIAGLLKTGTIHRRERTRRGRDQPVHRNPATLVTPTGSILRARSISPRQINTSSRERNERGAPEERRQKRSRRDGRVAGT